MRGITIASFWVVKLAMFMSPIIGDAEADNEQPTILTKRDLVTRVSEETGLVRTKVFVVVQKALEHIAKSLGKGGKVELRNFGIFDVKIRKARAGRNPKKQIRAKVLKLTSKR